MAHKNTKKSLLVNEQITAAYIKIVGDENLAGIMPLRKGLDIAAANNLDLVLINPDNNPPICKMVDYGKVLYKEQKKRQRMRKTQKIIELKEIKLRPNIQENDYNIKLERARRFILESNKIKFSMRFKGREIIFRDLGLKLFTRLKKDLGDIAKITQDIDKNYLKNRQVIIVFEPINVK